MKRTLAMLMGAVILLACVLSGCGDGNSTIPEDESNELTVYVVKTDALYQKAVNAFKREAKDLHITLDIKTYASYEAMLDVLNVELMAGGGPDVVLYNSKQGEVNAQKLAQSGMFLPLDSYIKDLDPEIYPTVLMDAGKLAGKQYFIPLSYNLIYAFTSEKIMEDGGYSTSDSIYEMIPRESDALANDDNLSNTVNIHRLDPVNSFFDAAGITLFDKNTGDVMVDKAEVEAVCSFVKSAVYDNWKKIQGLKKKPSTDVTVMLKEYSFFSEDYPFMNNVRYYQSMFPAKADSPMVAMPYHKLNNPEELCASIVCFGGVNANTKAPGAAYALLKHILDFEVSNSFNKQEESQVYYAPVSLAAYQKAIEELSNSQGVGPVTIKQLSEENGSQLAAVPQKITQATIPNMALGVSIGEIFEPYLMGEDSFDNCYKTFLNRLQIYASE